MPWWDQAPRIAGVDLYWFISAAIVTRAGRAVVPLRDDFVDEQTRTRGGDHWYSKLKFAPLPVISLLMVLFMGGLTGQRRLWTA